MLSHSLPQDPFLSQNQGMAQRSSLQQIAHTLHSARMATYLGSAHNDVARALDLYRWNLQLGAAFQEVLAVTEITLRNAVDHALRTWNAGQPRPDGEGLHSPHWLQDPARPLASLTRRTRDMARRQADDARSARPQNHPRKFAPITHDDILAQLTFGAFVELLPTPDEDAPTYRARHILWSEAMRTAFPHNDSHDPLGIVLADRVGRLHALRNRVSHLEPLLTVNVSARHTDVLRVIAAVSPATRDWCAGMSRVKETNQRRPA